MNGATLTPERFLARYHPLLPVPVFTPENKRGFHAAAFRDACQDLGVTFRKIGERDYEIVRGAEVIGRLNGMLTNLVSRDAVAICKSKQKTISHLGCAGVPVPEQHPFEADAIGAALNFAAGRDFAIVVKPCFGFGGDGITTTIRNEEDFRLAWSHAVANQAPGKPAPILVEAKCPGIDIRAIVVAGRFSCAATRVPANVIGDGRSTLDALIAQKNATRQANPYHSRYPVVVDERLLRRLAVRGIALGTVLPAGEPLILGEVSNVHAGGDACEITDLVPARIRAVAEQAANAIAGLGVAGVDMMVSTLDDDARVAVIEMNTHQNFSVHHSPMMGEPRNPAHDVVGAMLRAPSP